MPDSLDGIAIAALAWVGLCLSLYLGREARLVPTEPARYVSLDVLFDGGDEFPYDWKVQGL